VVRAEARSLALLNEARQKAGAVGLVVDPEMAAFARTWSETMAEGGFVHSSAPWAENIVWVGNNRLTAEQAAESFNDLWVNSPGHYANMIDPKFTSVGIGVFMDQSGWEATYVFR